MHLDLQVRLLDQNHTAFYWQASEAARLPSPKKKDPSCGCSPRRWGVSKRKSIGRVRGDVDWVYRVCSKLNPRVTLSAVDDVMRGVIKKRNASAGRGSQARTRMGVGRSRPQRATDVDLGLIIEGEDCFYIAVNSPTK